MALSFEIPTPHADELAIAVARMEDVRRQLERAWPSVQHAVEMVNFSRPWPGTDEPVQIFYP
jgi:hypothetical protein